MHIHPVAFLFMLAIPAAHAQPVCPSTPFTCAVEAAINAGFAFTSAAERGAEAGNRTVELHAMEVLAFLIRRDGIGWHGRALGYGGLVEADQRRLTLALRAVIDSTPALIEPRADFPPELIGKALMALSEWRASGGPDDVGATVTVNGAVENGVRSFARFEQIDGWGPGNPSATPAALIFSGAGVTAAESILEGAAVTRPAIIEALEARITFDADDDILMRLGAAWLHRLNGASTSSQTVQTHLAWLLPRYGQFDADDDPFLAAWLWRRLLNISLDDGLDGLVYAEAFAALDPAAEGFEEMPGVDFDVPLRLIQWQRADGAWGFAPGPRRDLWTSQFLALLTLSLGMPAWHPDTDGDGLINIGDNCPDVANPRQDDVDWDGVGDACDNCPNAPNRQQSDADADGIGDACAPVVEHCDPEPVACNGIDDDCDGRVDEVCELDAGLEPDGALTDDLGLGDADFGSASDLGPQAMPDAASPLDADLADATLDAQTDAAVDAAVDAANTERIRQRRRADCSSAPGAPSRPWTLMLLVGLSLARRSRRRSSPKPQ